ncbi:MAG TPA: hypothetical protein VFB16_16470 [Bauldia sp.]|nr:hypothetical protein [Bauldia sp.]
MLVRILAGLLLAAAFSSGAASADSAASTPAGDVSPDWEAVWRDCGASDRPDVSIPACDRIIGSHAEEPAKDALAHYNRGAAYLTRFKRTDSSADGSAAIFEFNRAIAENPKLAAAFSGRGSVYLLRADYDRAFADFDKGLQLDGRIFAARFGRGQIYEGREEWKNAVADYRAALDLLDKADPRAPELSARISALGRRIAGDQGATISVETVGHQTTIYVEGPISSGDDRKFADAAIQAAQDAVVVLNSPGGDLLAGIEIGKAIHLKGFPTRVSDGSSCASVCALAWLGGRPRMMARGSKVGFHAAFFDDAQLSITSSGNALVGAYLFGLGLSTDAITYMTSAPPRQMKWLTFDDANSIGLDVRELPFTPPQR